MGKLVRTIWIIGLAVLWLTTAAQAVQQAAETQASSVVNGADAADSTATGVYSCKLKFYAADDRLVSESEVAVLAPDFPATVCSVSQLPLTETLERVTCESCALFLIDPSSGVVLPDLTKIDETASNFLAGATYLRLGQLNAWLFCPDASRFELELLEGRPPDGVARASWDLRSGPTTFEQVGTLRGNLIPVSQSGSLIRAREN